VISGQSGSALVIGTAKLVAGIVYLPHPAAEAGSMPELSRIWKSFVLGQLGIEVA
jgi:hypothetical protein